MILNKKLLSCFFAVLSIPLVHYGQRTEYKEVFAPTDRLVQSAEKPYRDDLCLNGLWQFQPNIPVVNMEVNANNAVQIWLNDKQIINNTQAGKATASTLRLHQGWNHFQLRLTGNSGSGVFSGRLTCNQPAFLKELESASEKP